MVETSEALGMHESERLLTGSPAP